MTTKKLITIVLFAATAAFAQATESRMPVTDAEKIADALRAGPVFITKDATLLDWPSTPGGEYRVLRKGSSQWTCLPGDPDFPHDEPACYDPTFLSWIQDSRAGRRRRYRWSDIRSAPDQCDIAVLKEERGEVLFGFVARLCSLYAAADGQSMVTHIGEITGREYERWLRTG